MKEETENNTQIPDAAPPKRRRGRPLSGHAKDIIIHIRCTPEQKDMFMRMGGADWLRTFLDTIQEGFERKPARRAEETSSTGS